MRYHALACDYDGTIAGDGRVDADTLSALERLRASGRRLVLVTGRRLDDLMTVFDRLDLFDRVVAENGALLYRPDRRESHLLCAPPPGELVAELRRRGIEPAVGKVVVATWQPHEPVVLDAIRSLGLELQVLFNKGAVMVLPSGVNKATGLAAALAEMHMSTHNVVGVGDAENDHAFLAQCECGVAVANALPALKEHADMVTLCEQGAGVTELIDRLVATDLAELAPRLARHDIPLGERTGGGAVTVHPYGTSMLVCGTSGAGKSTLAAGFLERLGERGYQCCIIDSEGDYAAFEGAVALGDQRRPPGVQEAIDLLTRPHESVSLNLLGVALEDRPAFFEALFPRLQQLRARTGHPHWIVVDETHHLLPAVRNPAAQTAPPELHGLLLITVHPDHVSRTVLSAVDMVIAVGESPDRTLATFGAAVDLPPPPALRRQLDPGEAVAWFPRGPGAAFSFRSLPPRAELQRHVRKPA